jgi:hypothetical protein
MPHCVEKQQQLLQRRSGETLQWQLQCLLLLVRAAGPL